RPGGSASAPDKSARSHPQASGQPRRESAPAPQDNCPCYTRQCLWRTPALPVLQPTRGWAAAARDCIRAHRHARPQTPATDGAATAYAAALQCSLSVSLDSCVMTACVRASPQKAVNRAITSSTLRENVSHSLPNYVK